LPDGSAAARLLGPGTSRRWCAASRGQYTWVGSGDGCARIGRAWRTCVLGNPRVTSLRAFAKRRPGTWAVCSYSGDAHGVVRRPG